VSSPHEEAAAFLAKHPRLKRLVEAPAVRTRVQKGFRWFNQFRALAHGASHLAALESRYDELQHKQRELMHTIAQAEVRARAKDQELWLAVLNQRRHFAPLERIPRPVDTTRSHSMDESFARLSTLAPAAFREWRQLLDTNERTYRGLPTHSCSVESHETANHFASFVSPYLSGSILDIGCGPQAVPSYLQGANLEYVAGLDPLLPYEKHPFVFAQGVAEFLPWEDNTFDTVLAATSLDHVLLLDKTFAEVVRVLVPDGHFLTWVAFIGGSEPYDPYKDGVVPVDDYHLFHFDRDWFESAVSEYFIVDESFHLEALGSSFYAFRPIDAS
jgi:SAM-dependent methyltransferase